MGGAKLLGEGSRIRNGGAKLLGEWVQGKDLVGGPGGKAPRKL